MTNPPRTWLALLFALAYPTLLTWLYFIVLSRESAAVQQGAYTAGKIFQFAFPFIWTWLFHRHAIGRPRPTLPGVLAGIAMGLAVGGGMLLAYHYWLAPSELFKAATQPMTDKLTGLGLQSAAAFIALGLFYALVHSLLEEYYWRWFVFARLKDVTALSSAIFISSLGFMAHHVLIVATYFGWTAAVTWLFSLAVAVGGAAWAWLYHRSGSLVGPWLSHLLVDASIFMIGYDLVF